MISDAHFHICILNLYYFLLLIVFSHSPHRLHPSVISPVQFQAPPLQSLLVTVQVFLLQISLRETLAVVQAHHRQPLCLRQNRLNHRYRVLPAHQQVRPSRQLPGHLQAHLLAPSGAPAYRLQNHQAQTQAKHQHHPQLYRLQALLNLARKTGLLCLSS